MMTFKLYVFLFAEVQTVCKFLLMHQPLNKLHGDIPYPYTEQLESFTIWDVMTGPD
jgi:hypothetical protein